MVGQLAAEPCLRPLLCMTTASWDKLVFLNLPGTLVGKITQLVENSWGVQDSRTYEKVSHNIVPYTAKAGEHIFSQSICIQLLSAHQYS